MQNWNISLCQRGPDGADNYCAMTQLIPAGVRRNLGLSVPSGTGASQPALVISPSILTFSEVTERVRWERDQSSEAAEQRGRSLMEAHKAAAWRWATAAIARPYGRVKQKQKLTKSEELACYQQTRECKLCAGHIVQTETDKTVEKKTFIGVLMGCRYHSRRSFLSPRHVKVELKLSYCQESLQGLVSFCGFSRGFRWTLLKA